MRVLAAIFAHAGNVTFDVAGIERRFVERRIEQLDQAGLAADEPLFDRVHRKARPLGIPRAGENGPALRQRINLALCVGVRANRIAIIKIRAAIPLSIPRVFLNILPQQFRLRQAAGDKCGVVAPPRHLGKFRQDFVKEKRQPNAFAAPLRANQIKAVVPITAADQRQAVRAEFEAVLDGADAMFVERGRLFGARGQVIVTFFLRLQGAAFDEMDAFIENAGVVQALT